MALLLIALVYFLLLPKPPAELTATSGMLALSCALPPCQGPRRPDPRRDREVAALSRDAPALVKLVDRARVGADDHACERRGRQRSCRSWRSPSRGMPLTLKEDAGLLISLRKRSGALCVPPRCTSVRSRARHERERAEWGLCCARCSRSRRGRRGCGSRAPGGLTNLQPVRGECSEVPPGPLPESRGES